MPEETSLRPIWSGTITFGLVNVPVNLFPAIQSYGVHLRTLDEDGTPLRRRYYCPADEAQVEGNEIVRGYEVEKDQFIIIEDEELEALEEEVIEHLHLEDHVLLPRVSPGPARPC